MYFHLRSFLLSVVLSVLAAVFLFSLYLLLGNNDSFLLMNYDLGIVADYFFKYLTYFGDGLVWIPLLVFFIYKFKYRLLPLLLAAFGYSTIITQVFKYLIVPNEPRPMSAIENKDFIHTVKGVDIHLISSFPSGHTTTAFVILYVFSLCFPNKNLVWGLFTLCCLVGYSRIYLAQHFPRDLAGGILAAIVSIILSLITLKLIYKKKMIWV